MARPLESIDVAHVPTISDRETSIFCCIVLMTLTALSRSEVLKSSHENQLPVTIEEIAITIAAGFA